METQTYREGLAHRPMESTRAPRHGNMCIRSELIIKPAMEVFVMGRYLLLWLLGVPIPILVLIYAFGGLH